MSLDRRKFISATGVTIASLALAGCTGDENEPADPEPDPAQDDDFTDLEGEVGETPDFLKITSFNAYETADDVGVFGVVKNVSDNPIDNLEVEVTLHDGDTVIGEFIDTAEAEIDYLAPGESWRFNVVFDDENLSRATSFTVSAEGEVEENIDTVNGAINGNETTTPTA